ncbi:MAG: hypothetical protein H7X71_04335 [Chitinophagales bacterium]|nr:hypothetical protein [Chitinophagales bacterium]
MQHTLQSNTDNRTEMLNPLKSTLLNIYPEKEGWKLYNRYNWATKVFDFVLQKEEKQLLSRVLVEFNFESLVTRDHFSKLETLARRLNGNNCHLVKKIMIVDDTASVENTPGDVELIPISKLINGNMLHLGGKMQPKLVA